MKKKNSEENYHRRHKRHWDYTALGWRGQWPRFAPLGEGFLNVIMEKYKVALDPVDEGVHEFDRVEIEAVGVDVSQ